MYSLREAKQDLPFDHRIRYRLREPLGLVIRRVMSASAQTLIHTHLAPAITSQSKTAGHGRLSAYVRCWHDPPPGDYKLRERLVLDPCSPLDRTMVLSTSIAVS